MLRCPTCLNRLNSGAEKRCAACGTRIRTGRRANVLTDDVVFKRPRALVERELQARIEAQTAPGFRQRLRAARAARRIAALPSSLFEGGVVIESDTGAWSSHSSHPAVIDIPVTAIHETPRVAQLPAAPTEVITPPPPAEVISPPPPAAPPRAPLPWYDHDIDDGDAYDREPPPTITVRLRARWHAWRSARAEMRTNGHFAPVEPVAAAGEFDAEPADAIHRARVPRVGDRWKTWKPVPADDAVVNGNGVPAAATPVAPPAAPPAPKPERRRARPEPREMSPAARAPRGAEQWEPSSSLWANRVFSNSRGSQHASWPHPRPAKSEAGDPTLAD
jgi:hypothetical protein